MNLTLEQIFGTGAIQDSSSLTIQKSSLLGLNVSTNNKATTLLAAIINTTHQQFEGTLTDENNNPITDEKNNPITYDNTNYYTTMTVKFWSQIVTIDKTTLNSIFLFNLLQPFNESKKIDDSVKPIY